VFQALYLRQELDFSKHNQVRLGEIGGAGGLFVQVLLTPYVIARFGEKWTVVGGLSVFILYCLGYASNTVNTPTKAYYASLIQDVSNVNYPAITSIKSTLSAGNEQGQIIGAISSIQAIAGGLGPAVRVKSMNGPAANNYPNRSVGCTGVQLSLLIFTGARRNIRPATGLVVGSAIDGVQRGPCPDGARSAQDSSPTRAASQAGLQPGVGGPGREREHAGQTTALDEQLCAQDFWRSRLKIHRDQETFVAA
jgi:hypothetical protein